MACKSSTASQLIGKAAQRVASLGGFEAVVATVIETVEALRQLGDTLWDTALAQNPEPFSTIVSPERANLVAGTAIELLKNESRVPILVHVRLETGVLNTQAYLFMSLTSGRANSTQADVITSGTTPKAAIIVPPNKRLFVDGTDPDGIGVMTVTFSKILFRGRGGVFSGE